MDHTFPSGGGAPQAPPRDQQFPSSVAGSSRSFRSGRDFRHSSTRRGPATQTGNRITCFPMVVFAPRTFLARSGTPLGTHARSIRPGQDYRLGLPQEAKVCQLRSGAALLLFTCGPGLVRNPRSFLLIPLRPAATTVCKTNLALCYPRLLASVGALSGTTGSEAASANNALWENGSFSGDTASELLLRADSLGR